MAISRRWLSYRLYVSNIKSWLIVDDAHGFGVLPADVVNAQRVDIQVVTFGKALGCQGAAILASQQVINFLVAKARHYIYSTALSPANAHVALAAVNLLHSEPERVQALHNNIALFRQLSCTKGIQLTPSNSAIQAVIIGDNATTMVVAEALLEHGFKVGAIRSPTVPKGKARLRITLNALHQAQHIDGLVTHLAAIIHRTNL
jgi:8-amino-7-oxononanoate synthase